VSHALEGTGKNETRMDWAGHMDVSREAAAGHTAQILGRKRAFAIGCVSYGCGSPTTALAPNLAVLMLGWLVLEGVGAALIMPAIVALVASNFARDQRPRAYGLVASAGTIAVAAGPATLDS
jgi:MFS family permease